MTKNKSNLKKLAAEKAVEYVESGMVLGLGTGSTTSYAIRKIGERIRQGVLTDIAGIPTSNDSEQLSSEFGIPLTTLSNHPLIDLTIDGADEVDPALNLIKGGGGALLREKIVAQASRRVIIVVDESKLSPRLGTKWPLPIEVIAFGRKPAENFLESLGAKVSIRKGSDGSIFKTDEGNIILDSHFGPIDNPGELSRKLNQFAAIVENGLFVGLASEVIVSGEKGIQHLSP